MPREIAVDTVTIHDVTFDETVDFVIKWAREGSGGYMSTPNVDHIVRARRDPAFRKLVMDARLRIPDGMGVVYGSHITGTPFRGTVTGRLLPEAIIERSKPDVPTMALIGGREDAPAKAAARLTEDGREGRRRGRALDGLRDRRRRGPRDRREVQGGAAADRVRWLRRAQAGALDGRARRTTCRTP